MRTSWQVRIYFSRFEAGIGVGLGLGDIVAEGAGVGGARVEEGLDAIGGSRGGVASAKVEQQIMLVARNLIPPVGKNTQTSLSTGISKEAGTALYALPTGLR